MTEETTLEDIIKFLEESAVPIPYLDDYPILVTNYCKRAFIVISPEELKKLEKSVGINVPV